MTARKPIGTENWPKLTIAWNPDDPFEGNVCFEPSKRLGTTSQTKAEWFHDPFELISAIIKTFRLAGTHIDLNFIKIDFGRDRRDDEE